LTRRKDGLTVGHVGTLVNNKDGRSKTGHDISTSGDKAEIMYSVVINAGKVNESIGCGDDPHVGTNNAAVGAAIEESAPLSGEVACVDTEFVVVTHTGAVGCGRRHL
jgi:hypothetical protein